MAYFSPGSRRFEKKNKKKNTHNIEENCASIYFVELLRKLKLSPILFFFPYIFFLLLLYMTATRISYVALYELKSFDW